MRANAIRLLASMYHVHDSTHFPRGWVRPAMQAFIAAGVDCPNARCWRRRCRRDVLVGCAQYQPHLRALTRANSGIATIVAKRLPRDDCG